MRRLFLHICILLTGFTLLACGSSHTQADQPPSDTRVDTQFDYLAFEINTWLMRNRINRVVVADFWDAAEQVSEFGAYAADELTSRLSRVSQLSVIDQQRMRNSAGRNPRIEEVFEAAAGLGADVVVTGTVHDLGDVIRVNTRVVETSSYDVKFSTRANVTRTSRYVNMINSRVHPRQRQQPVTVAGNQRPDRNPQTRPEPQTEEDKDYRPMQPLIRQTRQGFSFTVISAKLKSPGNMEVVIAIESHHSDDRIMLVQPYSRFFDDNGNEVTRLQMRIRQNHSNYSYLEHLLFPGEPAYLYMNFSEVPGSPDMIRMLDIRLWEERSDRFAVELRNIPVEK